MSRPSQTQYANAKVPESVWVAKPSPVDNIGDTERVRKSRALLKVVAYPWGVEFEVCEGGELP